MNLTSEQRAAIDSDSPDILLSAGAGSGKTSTTVHRYERLLTGEYTDGRKGEPVEPSSILVFTFTDKAAGELRERIRSLRDERDMTFSMGSLWVGTFHSICARILRGHPVAATVDPAFEVIDDVVASRLKEAAYAAALKRSCETDEAVSLLSRFNASTLKEGIQSAYERLRAAGEFEPRLPEPRLRPLEEIQRELLREALAVTSDDSVGKAPIRKTENVIAALKNLRPEDLTLELLEGIDFYKTSSSKIPKLFALMRNAKVELRSRDIGPPYHAALSALLVNYGEEYEAAKTRRGGLDFEDLQLKTLDLLLRRPDIAAVYREQFIEIMVDEFQDTNRLQMDLIDQLRGEGTSLFTVGDEMQAIYGFRYADVELFRQRRAGLAHRLPSDPERRKAGERDEHRFEVEALSLSANFRSEAPVIGAVNEIGRQFEELISSGRTSSQPGGKTGGTRHEFEELKVGVVPGTGGNDALAPGVELLLTEAEVWQEADLGPLAPRPGESQNVTKSRGQHEAEALALAWHIRAAIEDGVRPGDIVVLLRTKTRMWMFEEALKQVGVRPYVVGGTGFWETREGVDLRSLLATVANPLDDESLSGTLAGPACGISPSALWLLAQQGNEEQRQPLWARLELLADQGLAGIEDPDRELARRFVDTIRDLQARRAGLSLAELVKAVVAGTGYDLVSAVRDPSGAGLANIRRVAEIAGEYEATEGRDLRGLVTWIDDSSRIDSEQAVATEDEGSDVVRLMTIHKSKGLEFPMVCVADLGRDFKSNSESVIWVSPRIDEPGRFDIGLRLPEAGGKSLDLYDWPTIQDQSKEETTDEELRILHVALTRAEKRLVLSGVASLEKVPGLSDSRSAATRVTQAFDVKEIENGIPVSAPEATEGADFELPDSVIEVTLVRPEDAEGLDRVIKITTPVTDASGAGTPPIERPPAAAFPQVPLSYSALAAYRDCPARFFATRVLKLDPPEAAGGASGVFAAEPLDPEMGQRSTADATAFGLAVHELLEALPAQKWRMPGDPAIEKVLAGFGVGSAGDLDLAREMLSGFIESELGRQVSSRRADMEAGLLAEIDGVMVRGYADLLLRDSDRPLVLDYKSNQLEGTSIEELMKKYDLQRDLYALAVSQALQADEVDTAFVFLRSPGSPVIDRFDRDRLDQAKSSVAALVGDIARGRYLGGSSATHQPCGDCWACELLSGGISG